MGNAISHETCLDWRRGSPPLTIFPLLRLLNHPFSPVESVAILETAALTTIEEDKENVAVSLSSSSIVVRADSIYVRVYIYIF